MASWTAPTFEPPASLRGAATLESWREATRIIGLRHGFDGSAAAMASSGSDVVLRCGDVFVKMTAPRWADESRAEASALARCAYKLPVATPEFVAEGELDGWPYVVMRALPGQAIGEVWTSLERSERLRLATQLGEVTACLHALPVDAVSAEEWPGFFERAREGAAKRQRAAGLSDAWVERIEPFLHSVEPLSGGGTVWLHTEILDEHVLVEDRGGRWEISGLIDFADGRAGHRAYEFPALAEFIFRGEEGMLGAFLRAYGFDEAVFDERTSRELMAWNLIHQFGVVARGLAAVGAPEPGGFEELARRLYRY